MTSIEGERVVLRTTRSIIEALGGTAAVAHLCSTTAGVVSNWRIFDQFPAHSYIVLRDALKGKGITAPDDLWAMTKPRVRRTRRKSA